VAPAGTPKEAVLALADASLKSLQKKEVVERFGNIGTDVAPLGPADLGAFIQAEIANWAKLVRLAGIQPE
jgi:tripartite-type tricarboxylate transporter receptor subunit TctC